VPRRAQRWPETRRAVRAGLGGGFHLDVQATNLAGFDGDLGSIRQKAGVGKLDPVGPGANFTLRPRKSRSFPLNRERGNPALPFDQ